MIIQQTDPKVFAPVFRLEVAFNGDSGGPNTATHRQLVSNTIEGAAGHNDYLLYGNDVANIELDYVSEEDAVDLSELPLIKRVEGFTGTVFAKLKNARGISSRLLFDFTDKVGHDYVVNVEEPVADSYCAYSLARILEVVEAMEGPEMFTGATRKQLSAIPHEFFTGHAYSGGWSNAGGLRFTVVTKRHLLGVSHYGYSVGSVIGFLTMSGEIIYRTVIAVWNASQHFTSYFTDFSVTVLNEDLPVSVHILPVVGDWFVQVQPGATNSNYTYCPQSFSLILFNNDGHLVPAMMSATGDTSVAGQPTFDVGGVTISTRKTSLFSEPGRLNVSGLESYSYTNPSSPFYHDRRPGDSGSPVVAPVAAGWALCGIVSGAMWTASAINQILPLVDAYAGIDTGYAVVESPDPTL